MGGGPQGESNAIIYPILHAQYVITHPSSISSKLSTSYCKWSFYRVIRQNLIQYNVYDTFAFLLFYLYTGFKSSNDFSKQRKHIYLSRKPFANSSVFEHSGDYLSKWVNPAKMYTFKTINPSFKLACVLHQDAWIIQILMFLWKLLGGKLTPVTPPTPYPPPRRNRTNRIRLLGLSVSLLSGGEIRLPQLLPGQHSDPVKQSRSLWAIQRAYLPFTGGGAMPAISSAMPVA